MAELDDVVDGACLEETTVNPDEWNGYNRIGRRHGRVHRTIDHAGPRGTRALDADGEGVREVHCNTREGLWTGMRNFLRPSRGVSKWYLAQYVAIFQWGYKPQECDRGILETAVGDFFPEHRLPPMSQVF